MGDFARCPLPHAHHPRITGVEHCRCDVNGRGPCCRSGCGAVDTRERDCVRTARPGYLLCGGHMLGLEQHIAELPALYGDLLRAERGRSYGTKTSRTGHSEITVDDRTADCRRDLIGKVTSWVALVAEERQTVILPGESLEDRCTWLLGHLDWITRQLWADEFAVEMSDLYRRATALAWPSGARRVPLGPCVNVECPGQMETTVGLDEGQDALCSECDATVEAGRLAALGRAYRRQRHVTGTDALLVLASQGVVVTPAALWKWSERGQITSVWRGPRLLYDLDSVEAWAFRKEQAAG